MLRFWLLAAYHASTDLCALFSLPPPAAPPPPPFSLAAVVGEQFRESAGGDDVHHLLLVRAGDVVRRLRGRPRPEARVRGARVRHRRGRADGVLGHPQRRHGEQPIRVHVRHVGCGKMRALCVALLSTNEKRCRTRTRRFLEPAFGTIFLQIVCFNSLTLTLNRRLERMNVYVARRFFFEDAAAIAHGPPCACPPPYRCIAPPPPKRPPFPLP